MASIWDDRGYTRQMGRVCMVDGQTIPRKKTGDRRTGLDQGAGEISGRVSGGRVKMMAVVSCKTDARAFKYKSLN